MRYERVLIIRNSITSLCPCSVMEHTCQEGDPPHTLPVLTEELVRNEGYNLIIQEIHDLKMNQKFIVNDMKEVKENV